MQAEIYPCVSLSFDLPSVPNWALTGTVKGMSLEICKTTSGSFYPQQNKISRFAL